MFNRYDKPPLFSIVANIYTVRNQHLQKQQHHKFLHQTQCVSWPRDHLEATKICNKNTGNWPNLLGKTISNFFVRVPKCRLYVSTIFAHK